MEPLPGQVEHPCHLGHGDRNLGFVVEVVSHWTFSRHKFDADWTVWRQMFRFCKCWPQPWLFAEIGLTLDEPLTAMRHQSDGLATALRRCSRCGDALAVLLNWSVI
jgi:hypothetical protein